MYLNLWAFWIAVKALDQVDNFCLCDSSIFVPVKQPEGIDDLRVHPGRKFSGTLSHSDGFCCHPAGLGTGHHWNWCCTQLLVTDTVLHLFLQRCSGLLLLLLLASSCLILRRRCLVLCCVTDSSCRGGDRAPVFVGRYSPVSTAALSNRERE